MKNDLFEIIQKYVDSTILSSKALAEGDYKTANKQAKIHHKIFQGLESGNIDKNILVQMLDHEYIGVSAIAAIDLLRIKYEAQAAEGKLAEIASMDETNMGVDEKLTVMAAKVQLKSWKEEGYVSR
jgi:hypothetical protein